MSTILLTGATGSVSSAVLHALQGAGHHLIGLVRDPAKATALAAQGVELRTGDLNHLRTIEGAFAGVDVAFLLAPPTALAPFQSSNALWAARSAGVKHVVRMSAVGARKRSSGARPAPAPKSTERTPERSIVTGTG